ncbi:hypothetical protein, unlikely [Trypanosoma brucei gambiense DAL972]|uniref:Uncharacterized protein n=1 Tax=Trypanosoma brucei gambiense (strain MHOM/CI/86/DAL972) TaxID=679716 RepID=C9ZTH5_TRYB9|nr:hypothetical protein, unlikely [Trypanosoma brucei gambiense DAL972]CBH12710.1 hypothetical protein, unlikely [Trypanosoma brucei gambiense DAL972]|eukprot:XP_011774990.1 hypothetical protein, unlikely [Trypanosoma brucei gambiense DAL972]
MSAVATFSLFFPSGKGGEIFVAGPRDCGAVMSVFSWGLRSILKCISTTGQVCNKLFFIPIFYFLFLLLFICIVVATFFPFQHSFEKRKSALSVVPSLCFSRLLLAGSH